MDNIPENYVISWTALRHRDVGSIYLLIVDPLHDSNWIMSSRTSDIPFGALNWIDFDNDHRLGRIGPSPSHISLVDMLSGYFRTFRSFSLAMHQLARIEGYRNGYVMNPRSPRFERNLARKCTVVVQPLNVPVKSCQSSDSGPRGFRQDASVSRTEK